MDYNPFHQASKVVEYEIPGMLTVYADGSVSRGLQTSTEASEVPVDGVASRDAVMNADTGVKVRMYRPASLATAKSPLTAKFPLLFYFHGGGFCLGSTTYAAIHNFLQKLCKVTEAMIVSVDYRLAPEHRLPAAYEDCLDALNWVCDSGIDWLIDDADVTNCFVSGDSSGGTIVHQIMIGLANMEVGSRPKLIVRGFILIQPFFGSEEKTPFELKLMEEGEYYVCLAEWYDLFWKLSLPSGVDRNSPFCNPAAATRLPDYFEPTPMLVLLAGKDLLKERGLSYIQLAETQWEAKVEVLVEEDQLHGYHLFTHPDSLESERLLQMISLFVKVHSVKKTTQMNQLKSLVN